MMMKEKIIEQLESAIKDRKPKVNASKQSGNLNKAIYFSGIIEGIELSIRVLKGSVPDE